MRTLVLAMVVAMVTLLPGMTYDQPKIKLAHENNFTDVNCDELGDEGLRQVCVQEKARLEEEAVREHFISEGWARKQGKLIRSVFLEVNLEETSIKGFAVVIVSNPDTPGRAWAMKRFKTEQEAWDEVHDDRAFEFDTVYASRLPAR